MRRRPPTALAPKPPPDGVEARGLVKGTNANFSTVCLMVVLRPPSFWMPAQPSSRVRGEGGALVQPPRWGHPSRTGPRQGAEVRRSKGGRWGVTLRAELEGGHVVVEVVGQLEAQHQARLAQVVQVVAALLGDVHVDATAPDLARRRRGRSGSGVPPARRRGAGPSHLHRRGRVVVVEEPVHDAFVYQHQQRRAPHPTRARLRRRRPVILGRCPPRCLRARIRRGCRTCVSSSAPSSPKVEPSAYSWIK